MGSNWSLQWSDSFIRYDNGAGEKLLYHLSFDQIVFFNVFFSFRNAARVVFKLVYESWYQANVDDDSMTIH